VTRSREPANVGVLLGLTAAYFGAGKLGLSLALVHASASAVWPPTGIALAALLLLGRSAWPAILAGAFLVNVTTAGNAATSLGIAIGNTLEGIVGAELVKRYAGGTRAFDRAQDVFKFVGLAGVLATAISPTIGLTSLCLGGFAPWPAYSDIWLTWWLGDAGGAVVVAPAIVLWARRPRPGWAREQWLEAGALLGASAAVGAVTFGGLPGPPVSERSLTVLCLPPAIWAAFRFGRRETSGVVLLLAGIAIWGTVRGTGPFTASQENRSLLLLQLFMGVVSVTSLSLAAVVSERRRALEGLARQAEELARSNAELDEFARVVSHDLKAPLRAISSRATWLFEDCRDLLPRGSGEHLRVLDEQARRLSRLIDGVLGYSRVGRGRFALERVDSMAIAEEVIDALGPLAAVLVRIDGPLPVVRYDRTQLTQVFQNLIHNAVEHLGRASGEVVVSCRARHSEVEFEVRDDGVGIPAPRLERIHRALRGEEVESSGLGLVIVRRIVEMHGGSVTVLSTSGEGTAIRFSIPAELGRPLPAADPRGWH